MEEDSERMAQMELSLESIEIDCQPSRVFTEKFQTFICKLIWLLKISNGTFLRLRTSESQKDLDELQLVNR